MLNETDAIPNGSGAEFLRACPDILPVLIGASVPDFSCEDMCTIRRISGTYKNKMYKARPQARGELDNCPLTLAASYLDSGVVYKQQMDHPRIL